ncbi:MAG: hypothetical protein GY906_33855, partial [bacterium]|nr:hypothetical protein [bacterium]
PQTGACVDQDRVTQNDGTLDPDMGPNDLQNFPVLNPDIVRTAGAHLGVGGSLESAEGQYTIDVYASETYDPSFHGEGAIPVGSFTLDLGSSGYATFENVIDVNPDTIGDIPGGWSITTTATDPAGSTSEFSARELATSSADLELTVQDSPDPVAHGTQLEWNLTVTNRSLYENATGVTVFARLPKKVLVVDDGGCVAKGLPICGCAGTITCDLGLLEATTVATRTITLLVKSTEPSISTTFEASCAQDELTEENNTVEVETTVNQPLAANTTAQSDSPGRAKTKAATAAIESLATEVQ